MPRALLGALVLLLGLPVASADPEPCTELRPDCLAPGGPNGHLSSEWPVPYCMGGTVDLGSADVDLVADVGRSCRAAPTEG